MATITKKAANRISELLMEIDLYRGLARSSAGQGTGEYWRYVLTEGLAVRALFDEFGIEEVGLGYNTVERIEALKLEVEREAERKTVTSSVAFFKLKKEDGIPKARGVRMSDMYQVIGEKIRELRGAMSQEALAIDLEIKPNKLSRWETGTYKPTAVDLDKLARYFNVPITVFFPGQIEETGRISALASATGGLEDEDFDEVLRYAQFRKAQIALQKVKKPKRK